MHGDVAGDYIGIQICMNKTMEKRITFSTADSFLLLAEDAVQIADQMAADFSIAMCPR